MKIDIFGNIIETNSYYNTPGARELCHKVKDLNPDAIRQMAQYLSSAQTITKKSVLVPAPQHTGHAEYTKEIAAIIARETGATVADILKRRPGDTLYETKALGLTIKPDLYTLSEVPKSDAIFLVDNVLATGATYLTARELIPGIIPLVYAVDEKKLITTIENNTIEYLSKPSQ